MGTASPQQVKQQHQSFVVQMAKEEWCFFMVNTKNDIRKQDTIKLTMPKLYFFFTTMWQGWPLLISLLYGIIPLFWTVLHSVYISIYLHFQSLYSPINSNYISFWRELGFLLYIQLSNCTFAKSYINISNRNSICKITRLYLK